MHASCGLGDAEVEHARHAVGAHEDILRGHVAMDEPERLALLVDRHVRGVQALERAGHDGDDHARRQPFSTVARALDQARERLATDVLHHEEQLVLAHDHVERGDHVGVLDARGEARLVEEHRRELGVVRVLRMQPLDGDGPEEAGGPDEAAQMDSGHPARGDRVVDRVAIDEQRSRGGRSVLCRSPSHPSERVRKRARPDQSVPAIHGGSRPRRHGGA